MNRYTFATLFWIVKCNFVIVGILYSTKITRNSLKLSHYRQLSEEEKERKMSICWCKNIEFNFHPPKNLQKGANWVSLVIEIQFCTIPWDKRISANEPIYTVYIHNYLSWTQNWKMLFQIIFWYHNVENNYCQRLQKHLKDYRFSMKDGQHHRYH